MRMSSKVLSNILVLLVGLLFVFSMFSIGFSFSSVIKDIVYAAGFLTTIILVILIRKQHQTGNEPY